MINQNDDSIAQEIFESGMYTQFFGVTAGVFGFIVFLLANLKYRVEDSLVPIWKYGCPIIIAYGTILLTMFLRWLFRSWRCWSTPKAALLYIYYVFIFSDIILLGWLVYLTGGTRNSVFMPIFLLIPAVATCYCNPRKGFFWCATIATIVVLGAVSFFTPTSPQQSPNLSNAEIFYLSVLNILGILTAAMCYFSTNRIRTNYCEKQLNYSDNCNRFYL